MLAILLCIDNHVKKGYLNQTQSLDIVLNTAFFDQKLVNQVLKFKSLKRGKEVNKKARSHKLCKE
jgi:hypothetical protein